MSVLLLSYWENDIYWRQNNKHFAELAPQNGGKQLIWRNYVTVTLCIPSQQIGLVWKTRRPASAYRTACRQFQAVFPVITGNFPTNVIAHLHGLSMDLTVGWTVGPTLDSTVGWTVGLTVNLCKHWFDSRSNYWSNCGNHWPTSEPNAG